MGMKECNLQGTKEIKATTLPLKSSKPEYTAASTLGAI